MSNLIDCHIDEIRLLTVFCVLKQSGIIKNNTFAEWLSEVDQIAVLQLKNVISSVQSCTAEG